MTILSKKFGEIPLRELFLLQDKNLNSKRYTSYGRYGEFLLLHIFTNQFSAWLIDVRSKENDTLTFVFPFPVIVLHLSITHSIVSHTTEILHENSFMLYYAPYYNFQIEITKDTPFYFFELFIDKSNLQRSQKRYAGLNKILQAIENNEQIKYFKHPLTIDFNQLQIIENIKATNTEREFNKCCKIFLTDCLNIVAKNKNKVPQKLSLKEANKIYKVRQFIDAHMTDKNLTLQKIAKETKVSVFIIKHGFKKMYHTTPHQYIILIRLKYSLLLLTATNRTISDIAETIGFEHTQTFNRLFNHLYNISPLQYRKHSKSV